MLAPNPRETWALVFALVSLFAGFTLAIVTPNERNLMLKAIQIFFLELEIKMLEFEHRRMTKKIAKYDSL